jgi:pyridoxal phosphate enzyme (YggS family)
MDLASRLSGVLERIDQAVKRAGREAREVTLVAVSKKQSLDCMREYLQAAELAGIGVVFGENYVQELKLKREELGEGVEIHLIGPLQSNKIKEAVRLADLIQSVHSSAVISAIAKEARKLGKRQRIYLQVNIGHDPAKSGFAPDQLQAALELAGGEGDAVSLEGLMTITPFYDQAESARSDFRAMSELKNSLIARGLEHFFADRRIRLSMGMSADYDIAIEEGADLVRVGTAIFGERV